MTEKIRDLADWAEAKFSSLCSAAGVVRNPSIQDRTGWDYQSILTQIVQPEDLTLLPDRPLFADIVDRPTASYLSRSCRGPIAAGRWIS